jgi:hypothetical protein
MSPDKSAKETTIDDCPFCHMKYRSGKNCYYTHSQGECIFNLNAKITALKAKLSEKDKEIERLRGWKDSQGIHTCRDECENLLCVANRKVAVLEEELKWRRAVHGVTGEVDKLKAQVAELIELNKNLRASLDIAEKALEWEEKRCGRLHGPLAEALQTIHETTGKTPVIESGNAQEKETKGNATET